MTMYNDIFDATNMMTIDAVEVSTSINDSIGGIKQVIKDDKRPNFSFSSIVDFIKRRDTDCSISTMFIEPMTLNRRWVLTIVGRGQVYADVSKNDNLENRFRSMFKALDSKSIVELRIHESGYLVVDHVITTFYPRADILDNNITTYWDEDSVSYMSNFIETNNFDDFMCDIYIGHKNECIRNVKCIPALNRSYGSIAVTFNGYPFHFEITVNDLNDRLQCIKVNYKQIINIREVNNDKSYLTDWEDFK